MLTDIEIAQATEPKPIGEIAAIAGVDEKYLELYGNYKAKVDYNLLREEGHAPGKLILVTAINPTPAGEGKTTTTVGLADALSLRGKNVVVALREPSLGPVFGIKGGAAGGGYAQVIPMEDINLHFTGDFHAIGAANNLLAALLDAHIQNGNELNIDVRKITWKRVVDMNDRQLRHIVDGLGGKAHGVPREDGFDITVASEVMAIFCLATSITDLKERLGRIVVGYTYDDKPVTAHDLKAEGAMAALLKDALKPNLVQTLEGTPAFVHGGPFANIAHGCNSIMATRMAMALGDYCVTEAGFGADLGAEKFLDIKCRLAGLKPDAVVVVATVRALKNHGGVAKADLNEENLEALEAGLPNLLQHVENITNVYNLPCVVAINAFPTDTKAELDLVEAKCRELGVNVALSEVWARGGEGGLALADEVVALCENGDEAGRSADTFTFSYEDDLSIAEKIEAIAKRVYHADGVVFEPAAQKEIAQLEALGFGEMPVCMAKTQYSFSDDATKLGAPRDFQITVRQVKVSAGAGFIVALTGSIMTMPGLGKAPAAHKIDVMEDGTITGLFQHLRSCPGSDSERKCRAQTTLKCTVGVLLRTCFVHFNELRAVPPHRVRALLFRKEGFAWSIPSLWRRWLQRPRLPVEAGPRPMRGRLRRRWLPWWATSPWARRSTPMSRSGCGPSSSSWTTRGRTCCRSSTRTLAPSNPSLPLTGCPRTPMLSVRPRTRRCRRRSWAPARCRLRSWPAACRSSSPACSWPGTARCWLSRMPGRAPCSPKQRLWRRA